MAAQLKSQFVKQKDSGPLYRELLLLMYSLLDLAKSKGLRELDEHVENPQTSSIFLAYPLVLEHQALVLEALDEIDQVLAVLPAKSRQAFLMAQLEGYTQEEIANRLSLSVRSVQRHLARAFEECIVLASGSSHYA